jgi:hypothetical protein
VSRAVRDQFAVVEGARLKVRAVVLPSDGASRWAWFAKVPLAEPVADFRVFLNIDDLQPLLVYPASVAALFGEARVYVGSPSRNTTPVSVCLRELGPNPADVLAGSRVRVTTGNGDVAHKADRNFTFDIDEDAFDEASVFHLVSEALSYFGRLFRHDPFDQPQFRPLQVVVHDPASPNNAYFHPDRRILTFGDFASGRWPARSADIAIHEVGHAVTHAVGRVSDTPSKQARGVGEGYSDYFACSFLDDPRFGDYMMDKPKGARNCAKKNLHVGEDLVGVDPYKLGLNQAQDPARGRRTPGLSRFPAVAS